MATQTKHGQVQTPADVAATLKIAAELARRAHRDEALERLAGCDEWESPFDERALLLKAEVLGRRDAVASLTFLASHSEAFKTPEGRFGYFVSSANAYVNSRNFDGARDMLASAQQLAKDDLARVARLGYERSRLQWA